MHAVTRNSDDHGRFRLKDTRVIETPTGRPLCADAASLRSVLVAHATQEIDADVAYAGKRVGAPTPRSSLLYTLVTGFAAEVPPRLFAVRPRQSPLLLAEGALALSILDGSAQRAVLEGVNAALAAKASGVVGTQVAIDEGTSDTALQRDQRFVGIALAKL